MVKKNLFYRLPPFRFPGFPEFLFPGLRFLLSGLFLPDVLVFFELELPVLSFRDSPVFDKGDGSFLLTAQSYF